MKEDKINDNQVLPYLKSWLEKEEAKYEGLEGIEKAQGWTLINELKTAIGRIEFCEKYGLFDSAQVYELPEPANWQTEYLLVNDGESSNPVNWTEVKSNFPLHAGDLVIKK